MRFQTLKEYIQAVYNGNQSKFGRNQNPPLHRQAVNQMLKDEKHYVFEGKLFLFKRVLGEGENNE